MDMANSADGSTNNSSIPELNSFQMASLPIAGGGGPQLIIKSDGRVFGAMGYDWLRPAWDPGELEHRQWHQHTAMQHRLETASFAACAGGGRWSPACLYTSGGSPLGNGATIITEDTLRDGSHTTRYMASPLPRGKIGLERRSSSTDCMLEGSHSACLSSRMAASAAMGRNGLWTQLAHRQRNYNACTSIPARGSIPSNVTRSLRRGVYAQSFFINVRRRAYWADEVRRRFTDNSATGSPVRAPVPISFLRGRIVRPSRTCRCIAWYYYSSNNKFSKLERPPARFSGTFYLLTSRRNPARPFSQCDPGSD